MREKLDSLRTRFTGCSIVAFADLSTGLVFAASTREKTDQERLDALCHEARDVLCGPVAKTMAETGFPSRQEPMHAVSFGAGRLSLFVRTLSQPQEALCFVCDPNTSVTEMIEFSSSACQSPSSESGEASRSPSPSRRSSPNALRNHAQPRDTGARATRSSPGLDTSSPFNRFAFQPPRSPGTTQVRQPT